MLDKMKAIVSWFVGLAVVCLLIMGEAYMIRQRARSEYRSEAPE